MAAPLKNLPDGSVAVYHHACEGTPIQEEPLVLLHGWGSDSHIWQEMLPLLTPHFHVLLVDLPGFGESPALNNDDPDDYMAALLAILPERCSLVGWSLGGMLATALASRYPDRIVHLLTIASNPVFVQTDGWSSAMTSAEFADFNESFRQQPALCLKRFQGLQCRGDDHERELIIQLRGVSGVPSHSQEAAWRRGLDLLQLLDNRAALASLSVPGLHIFGGADQLVPSATAAALQALNPAQQSVVLDGTAHIPLLSCPQRLAEEIIHFIQTDRYRLDKTHIAQSFSRAANSYDSVARLQRQVGQQLLEQLSPTMELLSIVDLGCGTGYFTTRLAERYSPASLKGIDLAQGMLDYAQQQHGDCAMWLCDDAESLSLPDQSVDLVFSNLAFQWCERLPQLAAELARVLKPGGAVAFTSLGEQTLYELRNAWATVDGYVHVNRFQSAQHWHEVFAQAGFCFEHFTVEPEVLQYRDLRHLTSELKGLGAHNVNQGRNPKMTGRDPIRRLMAAYERFRDSDGQLPATWEVIYGVARKDG
ncbi:malonyl-ACP O-methyltransferase BioC [Porticoccus sp.]|nr:MAG: malonyl-[acyl-carrier protein] O-methyltransferase BioC [Gammaproteobacteria bacterium]